MKFVNWSPVRTLFHLQALSRWWPKDIKFVNWSSVSLFYLQALSCWWPKDFNLLIVLWLRPCFFCRLCHVGSLKTLNLLIGLRLACFICSFICRLVV